LARCEACGATVVQRDDGFECPRCATTRPAVCLSCHGSRFRVVRPGITRVRDELAALLPRATVAAVDASAVDVPSVPVLVGTEALLHRVAAHDGGSVGLVAYLDLDQELLSPRVRAAEQALWLLVRGARTLGGPGTGAQGGSLLLQTRLPDHEVVRAAVEGAPLAVADAERSRRRLLGFPPFGGVAELAGDPSAVAAACNALAAWAQVQVLGPTDDGTRALVKAPSVAALCDALRAASLDEARSLGRLRVDVDPRRV
jgi:primosomal protein N' (replication factor Y)